MANQKISELTAVTVPADTDLFEVVQSTSNKSETREQIKEFDEVTLAATDASYTVTSKRLIMYLDDVGDDTDIDVTFDAVLQSGQELIIVALDGGAAAHNVILPAGGSQTWDGTNKTAVFDTAGDYISVVSVGNRQLVVQANNGVTFS